MSQSIYHTRLETILSRIEADPSVWNQDSWHCGTSHCIAGHAQIDAGLSPDNVTAAVDGAQWLGLSPAVANWAFSQDRTLEELGSLRDYYLSGEYDPEGFDKDGFDEYGFDRIGYDESGLDAAGFDQDGVRHLD
jgi:hypothetical protein